MESHHWTLNIYMLNSLAGRRHNDIKHNFSSQRRYCLVAEPDCFSDYRRRYMLMGGRFAQGHLEEKVTLLGRSEPCQVSSKSTMRTAHSWISGIEPPRNRTKKELLNRSWEGSTQVPTINPLKSHIVRSESCLLLNFMGHVHEEKVSCWNKTANGCMRWVESGLGLVLLFLGTDWKTLNLPACILSEPNT